MKHLVLALAVLFASASLAPAQSLAEVAKKEKERRKKVDAQGKTAFTEKDLREGSRLPDTSSSTSTPPPGGTAGTPEGASAEETPAEQDPTKTQPYWRERVAAVNKKIQDLEAKLKSPELTTDPRGASRRQAAERDLAQARSEKQAIADEARKKGVPPGWVR